MLLDSLSISKQLEEKVNRQREHIGMVVLTRNHIQRLQVPELQCCRRLINDVGSFTKNPWGILLSFRSNHLENKVERNQQAINKNSMKAKDTLVSKTLSAVGNCWGRRVLTNLCTSFPGCFCFSSHGTLKLLGQADVFAARYTKRERESKHGQRE